MSNLDFPISILNFLLSKFLKPCPAPIKIAMRRFDKINGVKRAIEILINEKQKDEMEERNLKKLKDDYEETIDDRNIKIIKEK